MGSVAEVDVKINNLSDYFTLAHHCVQYLSTVTFITKWPV